MHGPKQTYQVFKYFNLFFTVQNLLANYQWATASKKGNKKYTGTYLYFEALINKNKLNNHVQF